MSDNATIAKVKAVNKAHGYANKLCADLQATFAPLVGQKIEKADGGLLAKVAKLLPEFPHSPSLHVYRYISNYSLAWSVKTCEHIADTCGCLYYDVTVYVGDMRDGVLVKLSDPCVFRTDYTVAEVDAKREAYRAAKSAAGAAQSALYPFGEYDR